MVPLALHVIVALSYVTVKKIEPDGTVSERAAQKCSELAPGVNYCQELGEAGEDEVLEFVIHELPETCEKGSRLEKGGQFLAHYTAKASLMPSEESSWATFEVVDDFTHATAIKLDAGEKPQGWDEVLRGLCAGTKATVTIPPTLGFDNPNGKPPRPATVPLGASLRYEIEIISVLVVDSSGVPFRPCFFSLIDTDKSGDLDEVELARHFARINKPVPAHVMGEDTDGDGRISFDEFKGPKIPRKTRPDIKIVPPGARPGGGGAAAGVKRELR